MDDHYKTYIQKAEDLFLNQNKFNDAINYIEELLLQEKNQWYYYEKAWILYRHGKQGEALEVIQEGLNQDYKSYKLLELKSQFFVDYAMTLQPEEAIKNLDSAMLFISNSKKFYEEHDEVERFVKGLSSGGTEYVDYLNQENKYDAFIANINNLKNTFIVLRRIEKTEGIVVDTEQRLFKERVRVIEILGLFVAIFAFIFSSVQIMREANLDYVSSFSIVITLGFILYVFVLGLHLLLEPNDRTKNMWILLVSLLVILFLLPFFPDFVNSIKSCLNI